VEWNRGRECGRKRGGKCTGGGRGGGREGDSQEGGKREKEGEITQYCVIEKKRCKEEGPNKYRAETGIKGYGKWEV